MSWMMEAAAALYVGMLNTGIALRAWGARAGGAWRGSAGQSLAGNGLGCIGAVADPGPGDGPAWCRVNKQGLYQRRAQ